MPFSTTDIGSSSTPKSPIAFGILFRNAATRRRYCAMKPCRRMMPRSVYLPLLHMSFSPALHCGRRRTDGARSRRRDRPACSPLHLLADLLDDAEVLVAEDQELLAVGWLAVEAVIDFRVGRAQPTRSIFTAT